MGKLEQKVAIITGGAKGIGKQIALTFARNGADIVIGDISEMEAVAQEIKDLGQKVITVQADVSKRGEVENLINAAVDGFKTVDILVNNAGIPLGASLLEMTEEQWRFVIDVNLTGVFFCTQAAAKYMVEHKYGKIINIASVGGLSADAWVPLNYAASKAGVIQLTRSCAQQLGPYGINVNAIAPGTIITEIYDLMEPAKLEPFLEARKKMAALRRVGTTQDIADLALFLASDESSFITGQIIVADGGRAA